MPISAFELDFLDNSTLCMDMWGITGKMEARMQNILSTFKNTSDQIVFKMEDMGSRIDDLEKNVADLMTQAGMGEQQNK